MKKLIFDTAKAAFRRGFKQFKTQKARAKKLGTPVVPYDLVRQMLKEKLEVQNLQVRQKLKQSQVQEEE